MSKGPPWLQHQTAIRTSVVPGRVRVRASPLDVHIVTFGSAQIRRRVVVLNCRVHLQRWHIAQRDQDLTKAFIVKPLM